MEEYEKTIWENDVTSLDDVHLNKIENAIYDLYSAFYYKAGDSITFSWAGGGVLTSGSTEMQFAITLPKKIKSTIKPVITEGTLRVGKPSGGYIVNAVSILQDNTITINVYENIILIRLVHNTAYSETNNIPIGVQISNLKIEFENK